MTISTLLPLPSLPTPSIPPPPPQPKCTYASRNPSECLLTRGTKPLTLTPSLHAGHECPSFLNDWPLLLQTTIGSGDYLLGKAIHGLLVKYKLDRDVFTGNNLINMYAKASEMDSAQKVLEEMPMKDTVTWTTLMNGYCLNDDFESVFQLARDMHLDGERFNERTCTTVLQACRMPNSRKIGRQVHCLSIKMGFEEDVFVGTSLICMYARAGAMLDAEIVLDNLLCVDLRCLNSMILGYRNAEDGEKAINAFCKLQDFGLEANDYTFTNVISACDGAEYLSAGKQLHGLAAKYGCLSEVSVGNAIISVYGKHGLLSEAERMFYWMSEKNMVSWTALLSVYTKNGHIFAAIDLCIKMLHMGFWFDSSCLATLVDACSESRSLKLGYQIHALAMKLGYLSDNFVATAVINSYAKCGEYQLARQVFDSILDQDTAAFNAVVGCYLDTDGGEEDVIIFFNRMRLKGLKPDSMTFAQLLSLSSSHASITMGRCLHAYTIKAGFEAYSIVCNSIITMYAKCGSIEESCLKFQNIAERNLVSWNALVSAHALHGRGTEALDLFYKMEREETLPDQITMVAVLQACRHSGLYEVGCHLYDAMESRYGVKPGIEHHACMVDLFGRAGDLAKAIEFINSSQFVNSSLLWKTLVNACKLNGDMHFGKLASKRLLELASDDASSYILVSNFYASRGMVDESARLRMIMNDRKMRKKAGCSWIEVNNKVHQFVAGGKDHEDSREIYMRLDMLSKEMRETGYEPNGKLLLHDV